MPNRTPKEVVIEDYLCYEVERTGGEQRKCVWLGRKSAPDRFCWWPGRHAWVEVKRPGEDARPDQKREHVRMRAGGCTVFVIDTKEGVDSFIECMTGANNAGTK